MRLADFQFKEMRIESGFLQHRLHMLGEIGLQELRSGDVDRHRQHGNFFPVPAPHLQAGSAHDPQPDARHHADLLGQRDEAHRLDHAVLGMIPAQ